MKHLLRAPESSGLPAGVPSPLLPFPAAQFAAVLAAWVLFPMLGGEAKNRPEDHKIRKGLT
jgi:hypothetical protein